MVPNTEPLSVYMHGAQWTGLGTDCSNITDLQIHMVTWLIMAIGNEASYKIPRCEPWCWNIYLHLPQK